MATNSVSKVKLEEKRDGHAQPTTVSNAELVFIRMIMKSLKFTIFIIIELHNVSVPIFN